MAFLGSRNVLLIAALSLCLLAISVALQRQQQRHFLPIRKQTIETYQKDLDSNRYTSVDLVRTFLARIDEVNPSTHAITEINPDALKIAQDLDEERKVSGPRSVVHGLPILVKNMFAVDGLNTSAGSYMLLGAKSRQEASVIKRLREAGAIILGMANLSQWGNVRSTADTTSNGWSSHGGQCLGVYHPDQDPCGSSSGSATAIAMGLAVAGIGTETHGSLICPAEKSNLVGLKPTAGLVSRAYAIVNKRTRGSVGPITSNVRDAALLLELMAGKDSADLGTNTIPYENIPKYAEACDASALSGVRLGIPRNCFSHPYLKGMNLTSILQAFDGAISTLESAGAIVIDNANYTGYQELLDLKPDHAIVPSEYKVDMTKYLEDLVVNPNNIKSIQDMIDYTKSHSTEDYPNRDVAFWERAIRSPDPDLPEIVEANKLMYELAGSPGGIASALTAASADALVIPTVISPDLSGLVGFPVITIPLGYFPSDMPIKKDKKGELVKEGPNIPFGLSFIGLPWTDEKLIAIAYAFEQLTQVSRQLSPIVLPRTELSDIVIKKGVFRKLSSAFTWSPEKAEL